MNTVLFKGRRAVVTSGICECSPGEQTALLTAVASSVGCGDNLVPSEFIGKILR